MTEPCKSCKHCLDGCQPCKHCGVCRVCGQPAGVAKPAKSLKEALQRLANEPPLWRPIPGEHDELPWPPSGPTFYY